MKHNQQLNIIYTPYCYLIGWSQKKKYYYGVRYSKKLNCRYNCGCHPDDLWVTYFTSSKYVQECRSLYGEPDIVQVRKIFNNPAKAIEWEIKVLRRMNVQQDSKWINKNIAGAIFWDDELRNKMRGRVGSKRGKKMTDIRPGWVNPIKGKTAKERYKPGWVSYRKGKSLKEIWGCDFIDPRSVKFTICSKFRGEMTFTNVEECIRLTKLDGISILNLKRGKSRIIKRRSTTKHIFEEGDILYIK